MVESLVATVAMTTLLAVTRSQVTTSEVAAAAKFTRPEVLLIVCAPVVPPAVMVLPMLTSRTGEKLVPIRPSGVPAVELG